MKKSESTSIDKLFDLLDKWRMFPAYQLERRADIFIATFVPQLIQYKFKKNVIGILPEFPVRVGDIVPEVNINKSYRIDYVALCEDAAVFLIEFKTDMTSRRGSQDNYLEKAKVLNVKNLVEGLKKIYEVTTYKTKYRYYLSELEKWGWLKIANDTIVNTSTDYHIEIVYIQPTNDLNEPNIISFDDVVALLRNYDDPICSRLAASLDRWKVNPNI